MNTKDKVKEWDDILDEYEKGLGLPTYQGNQFSNEELEHYFSMDRKVLEKLTPQDCGEIAYRLGQFSFHVQRSINRELARSNWAGCRSLSKSAARPEFWSTTSRNGLPDNGRLESLGRWRDEQVQTYRSDDS